MGNGMKRVGIHIAAPSLAIKQGDKMEKNIMERLSTVYFPGGKITMLPENWIAAFSLDAGAYRPSISIYFDVDSEFNVGARPAKSKRSTSLKTCAFKPSSRISTPKPAWTKRAK